MTQTACRRNLGRAGGPALPSRPRSVGLGLRPDREDWGQTHSHPKGDAVQANACHAPGVVLWLGLPKAARTDGEIARSARNAGRRNTPVCGARQ